MNPSIPLPANRKKISIDAYPLAILPHIRNKINKFIIEKRII